jgi:hypothetical protein
VRGTLSPLLLVCQTVRQKAGLALMQRMAENL